MEGPKLPRYPRASILMLGVLAIVAAGGLSARDARAVVAAPPTPRLYVYDAPFVRTTSVELAFVMDSYGGPIAQYRASNDPAVSDGVLTDGVSVGESGLWPLAVGPDGSRTIYGQIQAQDGSWSAVAAIALVLATAPGTALAIDLDPQPGLGYDIHLPPGSDWHGVFALPGDQITAHTIPDGSADPTGLLISGGPWTVLFGDSAGSIGVGTHVVPQPIDDFHLGSVYAGVSHGSGNDCFGGGTFTIHAIAFTPDGDLASLSADFRLTCATYVMSGSIRYGSADAIVALDPTLDDAAFGTSPIGTPTAAQVAGYTNTGTVPTTLGNATLQGDDPGDFEITADTCSGATLAVGESCAVAVRADPTARSYRKAYLVIPDATPRGARQVLLTVAGLEPTSVAIATPVIPTFGPAEATIVVTTTPDVSGAILHVTDAQVVSPVSEVALSGPARREATYKVMLSPGPHDISVAFEAAAFYLASQAGPVHVDVGTKTTLTLSTATDDGVGLGESADLVARLDAGSALSGGTLRIRDGVTTAILASKSVSGVSDSLTYSLTPLLGTHPYSAEFVPASVDVQAATAAYDLTVVAGPRPETTMATSTLVTSWLQVQSAFSSPDSGVGFQCRVNESAWFSCTSPATFQASIGANTVSVRAQRADGLADRTPAIRPWIIDITPPTATGPTHALVAGTGLSDGRITVRLTWSGTDVGSGIAHYALGQSVDGGPWTTVSASLTATSVDRPLATQHSYRFRVQATDLANIVGDWATGTAFHLSGYSEASSTVTYGGSWRATSSSTYWGGAARSSSVAGAKASFTYTGRSIAFVSRLGPTRGKVTIYVDGTRVATVDLRANTYLGQRVVWVRNWTTAGRHTVTVRVSGTSGRPRVDVDGFIGGS